MPAERSGRLPVNPFDLTKVWPHEGLPAASRWAGSPSTATPTTTSPTSSRRRFDPGNFVPGHRPVARQDAPGPAVRLRRRPPLPPGHQPHPACRSTRRTPPRPTTTAATGSWPVTATGAGPRTTSRTASTARSRPSRPYAAPLDLDGATGTFEWDPRETDDFAQAGDLYRLQPADAQARLVDNIAGGLGAVSPGTVGDGIVERSIAHFRAADPELGERIAQGVKERRG